MDKSKYAKIDALIGTLAKCTVQSIDKNHVLICLGDLDGILMLNELSTQPQSGDVIDVYVEGETASGKLACSALKVEAVQTIDDIQNAFDNKTNINVEVIGVEENGLICDVMHIYGFMPKRQIEVSNVNVPLETYIGKTLLAQIVKLSNDGTVIVSHRAAIEEEVLKARNELSAKLAVGDQYMATVTQVLDYGAFADIGYGIEGLIHRSNLSWGNAEPSDVVSSGDQIKVSVLAYENGKLSLEHKSHIEDSWDRTIQNYHVNDIVTGIVTSITNFGAFVAVDGKLEGLVHNSELAWNNNITSANQILNIKDTVKVRILGIDLEKRKFSLSIKQAEQNPWFKAAEEYTPGKRCSLPIDNIADFGLFVSLGNGLKGLIHQNDISWQGGANFKSQYTVGQIVDCVVLSCDAEHGKAAFGIKQLAQDPWLEFVASKPVGKQFDAVIKRIAKFGAFALLEEPNVEGLIHISELATRRVQQVTDAVNIGDKVKVTVVSLDAAKKRLGLSMTAQPFTPEAEEENSEAPNAVHENANATFADILPSALKR